MKKIYEDIINFPATIGNSKTYSSKATFIGEVESAKVTASVDETKVTDNVIVSLQTATAKLQVATITGTSVDVTTGDSITIELTGNGWTSPNTFLNTLINNPVTLEVITTTTDGLALANELNTIAKQTIVTTVGEFKNQPLSNFIVFSGVLNGSFTISTTEGYKGSDVGFSVTVNSGTWNIPNGENFGYYLNNKYFLLSSPTVNYYVWYNVDSTGVDPEVATRTGIEVGLDVSDTAVAVATKTKTALDAVAGVFTTTRLGSVLSIANQVIGVSTDVDAGTSNFTVSKTVDGSAIAAEITDVTAVADVGYVLNNKYFYVSSPTDDYYVWYNVDSTGVDPEVATRTAVEVALTAGDTAEQVATKTKTVLDALGGAGVFTVTVAGAVMTITNKVNGACIDATAENSGFTTNVTVQGDAGTAEVTEVTTIAEAVSSLNDTYFYISSPTDDYYVWFNMEGHGTDPAITLKTGVEIAISSGDTAQTIAGLVETALHALPAFTASTVEAVTTVTNANTGAVLTVPSAQTSGFSITVTQLGSDGVAEVSEITTIDNISTPLIGEYYGEEYDWHDVTPSLSTNDIASGTSGLNCDIYDGDDLNEYVRVVVETDVTGALIADHDLTINLEIIASKSAIAESIKEVNYDLLGTKNDIANLETYVSDAIDVSKYNEELVFIITGTVINNVTVVVETTNGLTEDVTIGNGGVIDWTKATQDSGNSSTHISKYETLDDADWYEISAITALSTGTNTITVNQGIGSYIRLKFVADVDGAVSTLNVKLKMKG